MLLGYRWFPSRESRLCQSDPLCRDLKTTVQRPGSGERGKWRGPVVLLEMCVKSQQERATFSSVHSATKASGGILRQSPWGQEKKDRSNEIVPLFRLPGGRFLFGHPY